MYRIRKNVSECTCYISVVYRWKKTRVDIVSVPLVHHIEFVGSDKNDLGLHGGLAVDEAHSLGKIVIGPGPGFAVKGAECVEPA